MVLECVLVDGQPYQRGGTAVIGDQRQHDCGLLVGIEVAKLNPMLHVGNRTSERLFREWCFALPIGFARPVGTPKSANPVVSGADFAHSSRTWTNDRA